MHVRFLLGPAGSGKTFRCLEEIRAALQSNPQGPPLVFLAPKQATYQLERQLLSDESLAGYTRLRILSFERLAAFVFEQAGQPPPQLLDEEGRVMVLRALLASRKSDLKVFRSSSRLPGFARQLSQVLREIQQHHLTAQRLIKLTEEVGSLNRLDHKLHDLAVLLQGYHEWLDQHQLQDGDRWLDLATDILRRRGSHEINPGLKPDWIEGLWLDGFAQMTPQERSLLHALLNHCRRATLAFCLEHEPAEDPAWYSQWALLTQTYHQCRSDLAAAPEDEVEVETLLRSPDKNRFQGNEMLRHLERHWAHPRPFVSSNSPQEVLPGPSSDRDAIRIVKCPNPEAEATLAAREILNHVRAGGRFRETAVQVRSLSGYHASIRRVFARYEIPFFIDRRESVAHHPLAELTRNSLRTIAFGWKHDDWFGALKSGLVQPQDHEIDWLENEALAHGWEGRAWHAALSGDKSSETQQRAERLRTDLMRPFTQLSQALGPAPTGPDLDKALREFWNAWNVHETLRSWSQGTPTRNLMPGQEATSPPRAPMTQPLHETVWDQMKLWLDNVARAFPTEALPLIEWLPILEAGLSGLTVGVVPPVLDQVLVGAIDRSRNPDLKFAITLGWNETVMPASPPAPLLLTESDRNRLDDSGHGLGSGSKVFLGHERFYGYIACTRARERLLLSYAQRDGLGKILNPSPFLRHLQRLFPDLPEETFSGIIDWTKAQHGSELISPLLQYQAQQHAREIEDPDNSKETSTHDASLTKLEAHPTLATVLDRLRHLRTSTVPAALAPDLADRLYGKKLVTSVSRIEDFASCPFRFFVRSGLRVEERLRFELDIRQQGSFQHEVLARFHQALAQKNLRWRDISPADGQTLIETIADDLIPEFQNGMLIANDRNRFLAQNYKIALQQFIAVIIGWMKQYEFDPTAVELGFGMKDDQGEPELPAWDLPLDEERELVFIGRIDRIDIKHDPDRQTNLCVVIDYKSGQRKVDRVLMEHGIQQQLPAYLNVLRHLPEPHAALGDAPLVPAGVFYVPLRGHFEAGKNRRDVLSNLAEAQCSAFVHQGFADLEVRPLLDNRPGQLQGDQFPYKLTKSGEPYKGSTTLLAEEDFLALLDGQKQWLIKAGRRIFEGDVTIDPWKKGQDSACALCEFQSACRIDPWTHVYRVLTTS